MTQMPALETERLVVRPFELDDLDDVHRILDIELGDADVGAEGPQSPASRRQWLTWTVMGYQELAKLYQPPYGDRAIVLRSTGQLIGACGYVPCLIPSGQLPSAGNPAPGQPNAAEFGLYYAVAPAHQRKGYATEAARALVTYAFKVLRLKRIVATTHYDNTASMG